MSIGLSNSDLRIVESKYNLLTKNLKNTMNHIFTSKFFVFSVLCIFTLPAYATSTNLSAFQSRYPASSTDNIPGTGANCQVCHLNPNKNPTGDNPYGARLRALSGTIASRLAAIESENSDGSGYTNLQEITAGTQPGWNSPTASSPSVQLNPGSPTASVSGPTNAFTGDSVTFNSTGSNDGNPDGSITNYNFNWGDGFSNSGSSSSRSHTYVTGGTFTVTLTVTNNLGDMDTDTQTITIVVPGAQDLLLVDDDDNSPDVRSFYTQALDDIGLTYEIWDVNNGLNSEPDAAKLAQYQNKEVIWFTGDQFTSFGAGGNISAGAGPNQTSELLLADYLDNGGKLFISSQDYIYDHGGTTDFISNYLGVSDYAENVDALTIVGVNQFDGFGNYTLSYPFTNFSDALEAASEDYRIFSGDFSGSSFDGEAAAVMKQTSTYRSIFFAFPFEAIPTQADRAAVMARIIRSKPLAHVLLVDDDSQAADQLGLYTAALDSLDVSYSVWDTNTSDDEPNTETLSRYRKVIWFTGANSGVFTGPSSASESEISGYLDNGGNFTIVSQDYHFSRGQTPFMTNRLGVSLVSNDTGTATTTGVGSYISLGTNSTNFPFTDFSDRLEIGTSATTKAVMTGPEANGSNIVATVNKTSTYRAEYWALPLAALPTAAARTAAVRLIVFGGEESFCFVITAANGAVVSVCL